MCRSRPSTIPTRFFEPRVHRVARPGPDPDEVAAAAEALRVAERPLLIAGGGVHYSIAESELAAFAERHQVPVVETVAGKSCLTWDHPAFAGPIGVTGSSSANALAADADVVLAVGTRLQDFTTGSWSVFQDEGMRLIALNAARFDATKHLALPVVGDARRGLEELSAALGGWSAPAGWRARGAEVYAAWNAELDTAAAPPVGGAAPSYAAVIRTINELATPDDYALAAAGGLPGELNKHWRSLAVGTFDCEYGFSCMGYEIGGAWGAAMALPGRTVVSFCGDGSYLMASSEIYSSVLAGHPFVLVLCDNGGYAVIDRLQVSKGGEHFNNMLEDVRTSGTGEGRSASISNTTRRRWARGPGASRRSTSFRVAFADARGAGRTAVIVIETDPNAWTPGDAWWDVGVAEVSEREEVRVARAQHDAERKRQRVGV